MPSETHTVFHRELEAGLSDLAARSRLRSLAEVRGTNFCSNDYLGLSEHPHAAAGRA